MGSLGQNRSLVLVNISKLRHINGKLINENTSDPVLNPKTLRRRGGEGAGGFVDR